MTNKVIVQSVDKKFEPLIIPVRKRAREILVVLKKKNIRIDVILLGNRQIRTLNKIYRDKDAATNVLSFEEPKYFVYPRKQATALKRKGEIYINPEMSRDWRGGVGGRNNNDFLPIDFLLVHGILHLFGYDHIKDGDAKKMERKEQALMKKIKK